MIDRIARRIAHAFLIRIRVGHLVVLEDGAERSYGSGPPSARVCVRSPKVWRKLLRGSRGLAESYFDGLWDSPDPTAVIRVAARNVQSLDRFRARLAPVRAPFQKLRALLFSNTRARSRKAIAAHYDLGNDLFELMLDPTMSYSSAFFERPGMTLEQASVAKLELICRKLDLGPADHVAEIGTGWGGFAAYAALTRGCRVTTTTISREQHDYAVRRVRAAGVEDLVEVLLEDYRDLTGTYDKLVSIEMIEAVGWRHVGTFFRKCSDLLAPDGLMLLQAITIDDRAYDVEKLGRSFASTYVFPDGCLPSAEVIARCLSRHTDMQTLSVGDLTPHYTETVRRWRRNFDEAIARDRLDPAYDERFRRLWRLYLSYCEAGFAERRIGVAQFAFAKPRYRSEPALDLHAVGDSALSAAAAG